MNHSHSYISDLVRCPLKLRNVLILELFTVSAYLLKDFRPRCFSSCSFGKRWTTRLVQLFFTCHSMKFLATHSTDIQLHTYDAHPSRTPTIATSHPLYLSVYKSSTTLFAWPQLLPATKMDRGPVIYAEFSCAGLMSRSDEHSEPCKIELVRMPNSSYLSFWRCAQAPTSPVAAQYVIRTLPAFAFHYQYFFQANRLRELTE